MKLGKCFKNDEFEYSQQASGDAAKSVQLAARITTSPLRDPFKWIFIRTCSSIRVFLTIFHDLAHAERSSWVEPAKTSVDTVKSGARHQSCSSRVVGAFMP